MEEDGRYNNESRRERIERLIRAGVITRVWVTSRSRTGGIDV
jgi:hypothetical protein